MPASKFINNLVGMANPQKEDGYTQIANEIMEALARYGHFGSEEWRVLLFILRKTYGYHKKWDYISYSQIAKGTSLSRRNAIRAVNKLVSKQTLVKLEKGLMFNKNYEDWVVSKRTLVSKTASASVKNDQTSVQSDTKTSVSADTHKRKKETYKRKEILKKPLKEDERRRKKVLDDIREKYDFL